MRGLGRLNSKIGKTTYSYHHRLLSHKMPICADFRGLGGMPIPLKSSQQITKR